MYQKIKKFLSFNVLVSGLIIIFVISLGINLFSLRNQNIVEVPASDTTQYSDSITLIVREDYKTIPVHKGETLYSALYRAGKDGTIHFLAKEYPGLGYFVTEIGSLKQGEDGNVMYFINGKEASVGVSSYVPKDGDVVEWKI